MMRVTKKGVVNVPKQLIMTRGTKPTGEIVVRKNRRPKMKLYKGKALAKRVAMLEREVRADNKFKINTWINYANIPVTPNLGYSPTWNIVQGDTENTRNDDKICLQSYHLRYTLEAGLTATNIRVIVVLDKVPSEAAPTTGALFSSFGDGLTEAFWNPDYLGHRFKVLYDKRHELGYRDTVTAGSHSAAGPQHICKEVKIPVKGITTTFAANSGVVSSAATNHLYLLVYGLTNAATGFFYDRIGFTG